MPARARRGLSIRQGKACDGGPPRPVDHVGERREPVQARGVASPEPPTRPNQLWQLGFSEYDTISGHIVPIGRRHRRHQARKSLNLFTAQDVIRV